MKSKAATAALSLPFFVQAEKVRFFNCCEIVERACCYSDIYFSLIYEAMRIQIPWIIVNKGNFPG